MQNSKVIALLLGLVSADSLNVRPPRPNFIQALFSGNNNIEIPAEWGTNLARSMDIRNIKDSKELYRFDRMIDELNDAAEEAANPPDEEEAEEAEETSSRRLRSSKPKVQSTQQLTVGVHDTALQGLYADLVVGDQTIPFRVDTTKDWMTVKTEQWSGVNEHKFDTSASGTYT